MGPPVSVGEVTHVKVESFSSAASERRAGLVVALQVGVVAQQDPDPLHNDLISILRRNLQQRQLRVQQSPAGALSQRGTVIFGLL